MRIWMAPIKVSNVDMLKTFKTAAGQRAGRIDERKKSRSRGRRRSRSGETSRRSSERKRLRLDSRDQGMSEKLKQRERSKEKSRRFDSRLRGGGDVTAEKDSWYAAPEARSAGDRQRYESFEGNDVKGSELLDERYRKKVLKNNRPSSSRHCDARADDSHHRRKEKKERRHSKRSSRESHGEYSGYPDDHEKVNEVQDGFEIDSVGKVTSVLRFSSW